MSGRTLGKVLLGVFATLLVSAFVLTVGLLLTGQIHGETLWHHRLTNLDMLLWGVGGLGTLWTAMVVSDL